MSSSLKRHLLSVPNQDTYCKDTLTTVICLRMVGTRPRGYTGRFNGSEKSFHGSQATRLKKTLDDKERMREKGGKIK